MSLPMPATDTQLVVTDASSGSPTNYGLVIGWSSRPMPAIWVMRRNGGR